jgi:putative transposase
MPLYNHLLAERRAAWEQRQESLRYYDQASSLSALNAERPALTGAQSQVLQEDAARIDLALKAFLRRVRTGKQPGYPRFRGRRRYVSLTSPQAPSACKLDAEASRVRLYGVGLVKVILHSPLEGMPKSATISHSSTAKWRVSFSCERADPVPLPATGQQVGIDLGLKTFATLSEEQEIAIPRFFRAAEHQVAKAQRRLSKEEKGTPKRAQRPRVVARVRERIAWRRGDFAHHFSRRIANQFDLIAVEDLSVQRMTNLPCLAKSIHDAAWSQFASLLSSKAAWAGRRFVAVNPAYASQKRSSYGHLQALSLADHIYSRPGCGP